MSTRRLSYHTRVLLNAVQSYHLHPSKRQCSSSSGSSKPPIEIELPPEPTTCCMSGCSDCVWIAYAEELVKLLDGNAEEATQILLDKIQDPSLKMFLKMELGYRIKK